MKHYGIRLLSALLFVCLALCISACGNKGDLNIGGENELPQKTTWGQPVWSWDGVSSATATFKSSLDGHTETVTTTVISQETTQALTCSESGFERYSATVTFDGKHYTDVHIVTIPPSHHFVAPAWEWNGFTATARFNCTFTGCTHMESCVAVVTNIVTNAPTCTDTGLRTYTATVTFNSKTYTDTKTEPVPAVDPAYDDSGVCTVCGAPHEP